MKKAYFPFLNIFYSFILRETVIQLLLSQEMQTAPSRRWQLPCPVFCCNFELSPPISYFHRSCCFNFRLNVVRSSIIGTLRVSKQMCRALGYHKEKMRTVPLDEVPERRTERCSPRFRPGDRFLLDPSFRYLSSVDNYAGRE